MPAAPDHPGAGNMGRIQIGHQQVCFFTNYRRLSSVMRAMARDVQRLK